MDNGRTQARPGLRPTSDLGFKKILASEEHKTITQGFIKDFFGLDVELDDIHVVNPYSIPAFEADAPVLGLQKTLRDITIQVVNADSAVVIQVHKEVHSVKRAVYHLSNLYVSQRNEHQHNWKNLRPAWSMNVTTHQMFNDSCALHMFSLHDTRTGEPRLPVLAQLGFFELTKTETPTPVLSRWRDFLLTGEAQDDDPSYIRSAADIISGVNLSQVECDLNNALEIVSAFQEAMEQVAPAQEQG
ncbi:MAG: Rpn family recombination-promoting nuclease/putative transposase [Propionibacteriaceae bacterium]|nr:Rpn family recombination-promoting nuclease/putative transposase [Propionibacteriaceae bacterium]